MPPRTVFADTVYWIALLNPRDATHAAALAYGRTLGATRHVTTDLVLAEVLNHFSGGGPYWRGKAAAQVRQLRSIRTSKSCRHRRPTSMPPWPCTRVGRTRATV
jgi:predicted nucleic acid-binding protein